MAPARRPVCPRACANKEITMIEHKEISKEDIASRAYELYLQRGSEPGKDVEDWLQAEKVLAFQPSATRVAALK
jgi:hypothetical protein